MLADWGALVAPMLHIAHHQGTFEAGLTAAGALLSGLALGGAVLAISRALSRRRASQAPSQPAPPRPAGPVGLSPREMEVLRLLARGSSNREIAVALLVREPTVATHVRHILDKTGTANRTEAAAWAVREGLADR
jgi:DNA-binding NarL/FixJ family response regulator